MNTGVFFDLDGTLWDSADKVVKSWNETIKNEGYNIIITTQDMYNCMGKLMTEIADILLSSVPIEDRYNLLDKCETDENELLRKEGGTLYDNIEEVLASLSKEYKLFIVSNCQKGYIEAFLDYYGFHKYITDSENPGVTGLPKGDNIKLVAERNNIDNIIYVGDTNGDYLATLAAGGTFIHAAYGFGVPEDETYKVDDITKLPELIKKIIK